MLHIKATSANMGPGFDCAGIALQLYNEIWVETIPSGIEISSKTNENIPKDESNLIYSTIRDFYEAENIPMPGIRLIQDDHIPMTRGLGSSAACIVGGLIAANILSGKNYSKEELAQKAAKLEGHPDNSNPAIFGDMIISAMYSEGMKYTRSQSIFNSSRTGLMVASMMTGNLDNLRVAMDDAIHQPYRKNLIRGYDEVFEAARANGSVAEYLSGAGPTLMAIITDDKAEEFEKNMLDAFKKLPDHWDLKLLKPDIDGASFVEE